jgi:WD40 repeat protein
MADRARSDQVNEIARPAAPLWSLAFSPYGRWLAANGKSTSIFDAKTRELVIEIPGGSVPDFFVAFTPDGALLHAGGVRVVLAAATSHSR